MSDLPPAAPQRGFADEPAYADASDEPASAEASDEADLTRLADLVGLSLRLGRQADAARAAAELVARWPQSTTALELAGDVAIAQGQVGPAREYYRRALQIEPANADAERKYGASLLAQTPEERRAALIQEVIANPRAHRGNTRKPLNALINGLIFPGLGQLYNRQHEKGLVVLCSAAVALAVLLGLLMPYLSAQFTLSSPNGSPAQKESAQRVIENTGGGDWLLVAVAGVAYLGLYLWGLYDAWKQGQSKAERTLGV